MSAKFGRYVAPYDAKEKHLPGMNFAGPGTNVALRIERGVKPVDILDQACLQHDVHTEPRGPYMSKGVPSKLRIADRRLKQRAQRILRSGYRPAWKAVAIINAMEYLLRTGARGRR